MCVQINKYIYIYIYINIYIYMYVCVCMCVCDYVRVCVFCSGKFYIHVCSVHETPIYIKKMIMINIDHLSYKTVQKGLPKTTIGNFGPEVDESCND